MGPKAYWYSCRMLLVLRLVLAFLAESAVALVVGLFWDTAIILIWRFEKNSIFNGLTTNHISHADRFRLINNGIGWCGHRKHERKRRCKRCRQGKIQRVHIQAFCLRKSGVYWIDIVLIRVFGGDGPNCPASWVLSLWHIKGEKSCIIMECFTFEQRKLCMRSLFQRTLSLVNFHRPPFSTEWLITLEIGPLNHCKSPIFIEGVLT